MHVLDLEPGLGLCLKFQPVWNRAALLINAISNIEISEWLAVKSTGWIEHKMMIFEISRFQDTYSYKWILKYWLILIEYIIISYYILYHIYKPDVVVVVVVVASVVVVVVVGALVVVIIRQQLLHCHGWTQTFKFLEKSLQWGLV